MMKFISLAFLLFSQWVCGQLVVPPGNLGPAYFYPADPGNRLYKLPYAEGRTFEMTDGYYNDPNGHMRYSDHPDYSLDFTMPEGEPVLAARSGRVLSLSLTDSACRANSLVNYVIVSRVDSVPDTARPGFFKKMWTRDTYLHIDKHAAVKLGDGVVQGQVIGYIGCSATPHVHFEVNMDGHTGVNDTGYTFASIPTPFVEIASNDGYPLLGEKWTSRNRPAAAVEKGALRVAAPAISAFPNPFHNMVSFSGFTGKSELSIFAMDGGKVADLHAEQGQTVTWQAANSPSGFYMARMKAAGKVISRKLLLMD